MRWLKRAIRRWLRIDLDVPEIATTPIGSLHTECEPWFVIRIYRADNGKIIDYYARSTANTKTLNRLVIVPSDQPLPEALAVLMVKVEMGA